MNTIFLGVDLAKYTFAVCEVDAAGRVVRRREFKRDAFALHLAQLPAGTVVAMEACSSAHHWARRCLEYGLVPRLMAAQFVRPFRKNPLAKNDPNDAEAIATAARQGNMRFVPAKNIDQQARLSWHRVREGYKVEGLAIANRLRGLLAEFGVVVPNRATALCKVLADLDAYPELPAEFKELLRAQAEHWVQVRAAMAACNARIELHARHDARCARLRELVGVGPLTADAIVASIGNAREFKNGRQFAAWLGLVPSQHSSGGHARLGMISCRGDAYLRMLLIQGARSSLERAKRVSPEKSTPEQAWIRSLACRMLFGKVIVAIANKHARQIWAMLARDVDYDPGAYLHHPMQHMSSAA
jgi:transposase